MHLRCLFGHDWDGHVEIDYPAPRCRRCGAWHPRKAQERSVIGINVALSQLIRAHLRRLFVVGLLFGFCLTETFISAHHTLAWALATVTLAIAARLCCDVTEYRLAQINQRLRDLKP